MIETRDTPNLSVDPRNFNINAEDDKQQTKGKKENISSRAANLRIDHRRENEEKEPGFRSLSSPVKRLTGWGKKKSFEQ